MDTRTEDWRVTEGPAFGREPEFALTDVGRGMSFIVTGTTLRRVTARITATLPTLVESLGRPLSQLTGTLQIFDGHSGWTLPGWGEGQPVEIGDQRGAMWLRGADHDVVHLYLPTDQFDRLLPLVTPPFTTARLRIEVERTLDQGLLDTQVHFWNDAVSPVIVFNEFEFSFWDERSAA